MSAKRFELQDYEIKTRYETDARFIALRHGLNQLTTSQLLRVLKHLDCGAGMVCDSFNYDEDRQLWCPLAIGLEVPRWVDKWEDLLRMTNERAKALILRLGGRRRKDFSLNPLSGIPGRFFRNRRQSDVALVCRLLISER